MKPYEMPDDDFEDWFNEIVNSIGSFRLVLADSIMSALRYGNARQLAEDKLAAAGYDVYGMISEWQGEWIIRIDYHVIDANGNDIVFASIEKEGEQ